MRQIKTYSDYRLDEMCSYCGNHPQTRDHVPSKILLDEPFPENLPVVPCCLDCNQSFSLDEEYFACAIECVICGTTEVEMLKREKIKLILLKKESLRKRIENSFVVHDGVKVFEIEEKRFTNIIVKLAKGHAKYESSAPKFDQPKSIWIKPLISMTEEETDIFFEPTTADIASEVGGRALQNLIIDSTNNVFYNWTTVQSNNYRYSVNVGLSALTVKILLWNYLAIEVIWNED